MVKQTHEDPDNVIFTCSDCGKDTYFAIKALEKKRKMKDYVYVWFKHKSNSEKMWVKILKGSRLKGEGKIDNVPQILTKLKLHQLVKFKTDVEGITWGR
tara:strand:+ start:193 stop:489 length:297 start_codon:yes stop_codon:yes gene_type:complete